MTERRELVLVNPPISREERYGELAAGGNYLPPLGICVLASGMRERGISVAIVDAEREEMGADEACGKILGYSPRFVGITSTTTSIHNAAELAGRIKGASPETAIILGGAHVTILPEKTMERYGAFDYGVLREGELTLPELMSAHEGGGALGGVQGIIYRDNGVLKQTPHRPFIEDLDTVPFPAWDLLPHLPKYYVGPVHSYIRLPNSSLVTSRGCPGKCTYCSQWNLYQRILREHSAGYVFEMMKKLWVDYRIRDIYFLDDTFAIVKKRLVDLCETMIGEKWKQVWSCHLRVNLAKPDLLKLMRRAGCWQIAYGLESGSQDILNSLKKGIKLEQAGQALKWTKQAGIRTRGFFMIGVPHETEETIRETIDFSKRVALDDMHVSLFTPYPGSEIYASAHEYGTFDDDWRKMNGWFVLFVPHGLTKEKMMQLQKEMFREFYFRPRIILSYLRMMNNRAQLRRAAIGVLGLAKFLFKKQSKKTAFCS